METTGRHVLGLDSRALGLREVAGTTVGAEVGASIRQSHTLLPTPLTLELTNAREDASLTGFSILRISEFINQAYDRAVGCALR